MLYKNVYTGLVIDMTEDAAKFAAASPAYVPVEQPEIKAPKAPAKRRKTAGDSADED